MYVNEIVQEAIRDQRQNAMRFLSQKNGVGSNAEITMRNIRPGDIKTFTAGTSGTSKVVGDNDTTVATGTTENTLSDDIPVQEVFVIEGLYLPPVTGVTTNYVAMYIGDSKMRWYDPSRATVEENNTIYFDDPLLVKSGDHLQIKFTTSAASATHPIGIIGKVFKLQNA